MLKSPSDLVFEPRSVLSLASALEFPRAPPGGPQSPFRDGDFSDEVRRCDPPASNRRKSSAKIFSNSSGSSCPSTTISLARSLCFIELSLPTESGSPFPLGGLRTGRAHRVALVGFDALRRDAPRCERNSEVLGYPRLRFRCWRFIYYIACCSPRARTMTMFFIWETGRCVSFSAINPRARP